MDLYDQYVTEVQARTRQFSDGDISTEKSKPVDLNFCVDIDFLRSTIALGEISAVSSYDDLTDEVLRNYLESETAESRSKMTIEALDSLIRKNLRTDMHNKEVISRMNNLFVGYQTVLRKNGLSWVVAENPKVAVQQVLSAIHSPKIQSSLSSDMELAHIDIGKDFSKYYAHAKKLSEAFDLVHGGALDDYRTSENSSKKNSSHNRNNDGTSISNKKTGAGTGKKTGGDSDKRPQPLCLWDTHRFKAIRYRMQNCKDCPEDEKKTILAEWTRQRALDGPASSTGQAG